MPESVNPTQPPADPLDAAKSWVASDNFGDNDGPEAHADYALYIIPALITEVERLRSDVATLEMGLAWLVDWINGRRI
jgi:hypothetical protein